MWLINWTGLKISTALAQVGTTTPPSTGSGGIQIQNPLSCGDWGSCIQQALNGLIILAAPVASIMVLVGGFQLMSSGGDPEKVKNGKNTIVYAAVGYGAILLSTAVVAVMRSLLGP